MTNRQSGTQMEVDSNEEQGQAMLTDSATSIQHLYS
jgi:hypothetical protein